MPKSYSLDSVVKDFERFEILYMLEELPFERFKVRVEPSSRRTSKQCLSLFLVRAQMMDEAREET